MKLAEQFSNRTVKKVYYGITWGKWENNEGSIEQPIGRRRNDPTTYHVYLNGKKSHTDYKVINESEYFTEMKQTVSNSKSNKVFVDNSSLISFKLK